MKNSIAQNTEKTLREVIIDIIAKRTGGASFNEILTVMNNYWKRTDGKSLAKVSVSNHLSKMTTSGVLRFEERPSKRPGGKIRYYILDHLPTEPDTSKLTLITTEQAVSSKPSLPTLNWTPPRQHIPRKPNPLHQTGGAA